jgi:hypothetical protein
LTLLLAPGIAMFVFAVDRRILARPRLVAACAGALAITLVLVFLELPLRAGPFRAPMVYGRPDTWDGFWYIVLAAQFRESVIGPLADLPAKLADVAGRTAAAFGPLAPLIPIGFAATVAFRPRYALLSGTSALLTCAFAASYDNAEIARYYVGPALIAWTWLAILAAGLAAALGGAPDLESREGRGGSGGGVPDAARASRKDEWRDSPAARGTPTSEPLLALGLAAALLLPTVFGLPYRFARVDRSHDLAAGEWLDHVLTVMEPDAVVVSWWSYSTPLWYAQHIEGRRPDLTVIDDRTRLDQGLGDVSDVIDANLPTRPVYVIRVDPVEIAALERRYVLAYLDGEDATFLTRVVARREAGE